MPRKPAGVEYNLGVSNEALTNRSLDVFAPQDKDWFAEPTPTDTYAFGNSSY